MRIAFSIFIFVISIPFKIALISILLIVWCIALLGDVITKIVDDERQSIILEDKGWLFREHIIPTIMFPWDNIWE